MGSLYRLGLGWVALVLVGGCWLVPALAAQGSTASAQDAVRPVLLAEAQRRLEAIADQMRSIRLCNRPSCRYRDISVEVRPVDVSAPAEEPEEDPEYEGSIDALIDRPSGSFDKAHYRLRFHQGRWQLLGGEEVADVSSFFFEGDTYEVFSAYSSQSRRGKLADAPSSLRVGYRELYYRVLDQGQER